MTDWAYQKYSRDTSCGCPPGNTKRTVAAVLALKKPVCRKLVSVIIARESNRASLGETRASSAMTYTDQAGRNAYVVIRLSPMAMSVVRAYIKSVQRETRRVETLESRRFAIPMTIEKKTSGTTRSVSARRYSVPGIPSHRRHSGFARPTLSARPSATPMAAPAMIQKITCASRAAASFRVKKRPVFDALSESSETEDAKRRRDAMPRAANEQARKRSPHQPSTSSQS